MKNTLATLALASGLSAACGAATQAPVPENLLACAKLPDAGERVRCYDAQIAAMNNSSAPATSAPPAAASPAQAAAAAAPIAVAPAAVAPVAVTSTAVAPVAGAPAAPPSAPTSTASTAEQSRESQFGRDTLPPASRPAPTKEETTLLASIAAMREVRPKLYLISLSNGQVWRQDGTQITSFFRVGDDVRIEKGLLGSYQMSTPSLGAKNWVRVTRIQ